MEDNKMPSSTTTDKTGYFKLLKSPNSVSKLIFLAEGYQIDTTRTVWNRYDGAGKRFLNKIPDTLILRKLLHTKNNP
ncbi:hypothetical protein Q4603_14740 [Zobellia galactanivorans]|uniref:hypothetical protein n=1 Tax=Zobellia galactanivorans (strain DSM 12802 / CCUG 47099 / CIP 106680 / NCIMB 13871 / Dsij) TaxID=63186 RepID=UPI0026E21A30|nr:hypothetical protein [Zobellia galactanivorans]MDO6809881.1 hypothetical protein [Zobellia galactanivorans]